MFLALKYTGMKYAILRFGSRQYKLSEGEEALIDKVGKDPVFDVLLVSDGKKIVVGTPVVKDVKVKIKVVKDEEKGEKIDVLRYKAKSRYRKHIGFRPVYSRILVEKITF